MSRSTFDFTCRRISEHNRNKYKETFHSHRGLEILLIHQGKGTMIVNHKSYAIESGMICIFQPYQLHHIQLDYTGDQAFERSVLIFEPSRFEGYFTQWPSLHAFFRHMYQNELSTPCLYGIDESHELVRLFDDMNRKNHHLSEAELMEEDSLFLVMLFRLLKPLWEQKQDRTMTVRLRHNHHVEQILAWIEDHYMKPFQLKQMAEDLHLSPFYLSHLFKEAVGLNITEYITTRRLHQAVLLLTTTDKPVYLIAEEVGITNCSYFIKLFRSHKGATPLQYRKRWLK